MTGDEQSIDEIRDKVVLLLRENRGYSRQQFSDKRNRWNLDRFASHIEASREDIRQALTELCQEGVLTSFPEVGKGKCYSLDD